MTRRRLTAFAGCIACLGLASCVNIERRLYDGEPRDPNAVATLQSGALEFHVASIGGRAIQVPFGARIVRFELLPGDYEIRGNGTVTLTLLQTQTYYDFDCTFHLKAEAGTAYRIRQMLFPPGFALEPGTLPMDNTFRPSETTLSVCE